ncbi:MAG: RNA polymerase sigma factor [Muribaculaceae bacterium]
MAMNSVEFENIAPAMRRLSLLVARRMGMSSDDADDIAQDVLIKLWTMRGELHRFKSLEALVTVSTKHLAIDMWRRSSRSEPLDESITAELLDQTGSPHQQLEDVENSEWLLNRLSQSPSKEMMVLRMRQVEHREYSEIARLLAIGETSARSLLVRARKRLLEEIKKRNA